MCRSSTSVASTDVAARGHAERARRRPTNASASTSISAGTDVGGEQERQPDLRQRQPLRRAARLLLLRRCASRRNAARRGTSRGVAADGDGVGAARPRPRRPRDAVSVGDRRSRVRQPFTTTGPSATPARSSTANAVSTSSLTGVSSGSVTSITWQRAGSASSSTTSVACLRTGPTLHRVEQPAWPTSRNVIACPAAGASTMIRSAARSCSSYFTLPSTRMSFMPGTAVATTSSAPESTPGASRCASSRGLRGSRASAASGVSVRARTPGAQLGARRR